MSTDASAAEAPAVHQDLTHPEAAEIELTDIFGALAEPVRLAVLRVVADAYQAGEELSCSEIGERAGFTGAKSTLSHHYKTMREAGLVNMRYIGSRKYVSIRRADLEARFPGLLDAVLATAPKD